MKIALVQCNPTVGDFAGNAAALLRQIEKAREAGAQLAVCPELALIGYPPRDLLERPGFVARSQTALDEFAAKTTIPTIVGFVANAETPGGLLRNAAAVVVDGVIQSVHVKCLLPTYDVFDEWRHFEAADDVSVAEICRYKIGISICEDIWNDADFWPKPRYRRDPVEELVAQGAQVLINISASPFTLPKRRLRRRMLAAQAIKHARPLIMVNQVGGNDHIVFDGASAAFDKTGQLSACAAEFSDDMIVVDVDPIAGSVNGPRNDSFADDDPGDRGAALAALVLGTRDYVNKCGFSKVLLGLSGGIDSALTAAIAKRALGAENVLGVSMPSKYSSEHSKTDAETLAQNLGIEMKTIPIEAPVRAFASALADSFAGRPEDVTEENIQARCRGVILMALSNKYGHMLLTTGNKSELAVGYCTLYGDMSGGLAVISDVPKTMVYQLCEEFNRQEGGPVIPRSTIEKPPSAELRPDQLDQDSLPPYEILDRILELYVEQHRSRDEITQQGLDPTVVHRVLGLVQNSEYKRNQAAPGIKITAKAFGHGRRIPLAKRWRE